MGDMEPKEKKGLRLWHRPILQVYRMAIGLVVIALILVVSIEIVWMIIKFFIVNLHVN